MPFARSVDLSGSTLGHAGGRLLALTLAEAPALRELCLASTSLGPRGAEALAPVRLRFYNDVHFYQRFF